MKKQTIIGITVAAISFLLLAGPCLAALNDAGILNNQGVELYERGNVEAAIVKFEKAADLDEYNPTVYAHLGYAYQAIDQHEKAVAAFKKAISLDPTDLDVHNNMGASLYKMGEKDRAEAEWEYILTTDPQNLSAAANLGMVRHPDKADQILQETKVALMPQWEKDPRIASEMRTSFNRGKRAYLEGRYDDAVNQLRPVANAKADSKYTHYYLGMSYGYLSMSNSAMKHLREYLIQESYPPETPKLYKDAQTAFNTLKAGGVLNARITRASARAALLFRNGKEAYLQGDFFKAINILNEAYGLKPDFYEINYFLGFAYRKVDEKQKAVFHLTKCLLAGPEKRTKKEALELASIVKDLTEE